MSCWLQETPSSVPGVPGAQGQPRAPEWWPQSPEEAWDDFRSFSRPSSFARKGFSILVLDGAAPSLSQLCGVFPNRLEISRGSGSAFSGFFESVLFSVIQMTDTDFFVRMF